MDKEIIKLLKEIKLNQLVQIQIFKLLVEELRRKK